MTESVRVGNILYTVHTSTCTYAPHGGKLCGKPVLHNNRCQKHCLLLQPVDLPNGQRTCEHLFLTGQRRDYCCPRPAVSADGYCSKHARITANQEAAVTHCAHIFKSGDREGCYCPAEIDKDGYCWKHYLAHVGLTKPLVCEPGKFVEDPTCAVQFRNGDRKGLYCPGLATNGKYCRYHGAKYKPKEKAPSAKKKSTSVPCKYVIRKGRNEGQLCGQASRTGWCSRHQKHANTCGHKIEVVRYVYCSQRTDKGPCPDHQ